MGVVTKLIFYIIPIVVLVLLVVFFYSDAGAFEKVKNITSSAENYVPNISIGAKEITAQEISLPTEHKAQISRLKEKINLMMESDKKNCFANYGGFSSLGEKGTTIQIQYDAGADATHFTFKGGAGGQQEIPEEAFTIEKMHPCVIAGGSEITEKFWRKFIWKETIAGNYYFPVSSLEINSLAGDTHIRVPEFGADVVNDQDNNFEDHGQIFTPDNKHICFISTIYGSLSNFDEDGIDNDFVQLRGGPLPPC